MLLRFKNGTFRDFLTPMRPAARENQAGRSSLRQNVFIFCFHFLSDLAGRRTKTIENYVDGTVSDTDDKAVEYTYHANNQKKTLKAYLTSSTSETTEWILGTTSPIASNDIVLEMRYPDASTGASSSSEKDQYAYNLQGQIKTFTDRNGNVHSYSYDILGRLVSDAITTLGSGVDGAVRRIETAYDTQGNAYLFTSYDAATGGNVVNQIQREFNGLGQLITEWQAVGGTVNTSTSPKVQYAYSFTTSGSMNHSRLISITQPSSYVLNFNYSSGLDDNISRLSLISDSGNTLESYTFLGLGTVVNRAHPQPGMELTFIKQTGESNGDAGDQYIGLDRFGRNVDNRWRTSSTDLDRRQYGYDRNSNRLYMDNRVSSSNSELYAYDGLNQITSFSRGTLNGTKDGISGTPSRTQSWDFDALGNFDSQTTDGTGQTRSHNKQNEITSVSGATTPSYDANGNTLQDETGLQYVWDAWNRLVTIKSSGGSTLESFNYDGLSRRVTATVSGTTTTLYYSGHKIIEEWQNSQAVRRNVWSPADPIALVLRDRDTEANGSLEERLYALQDANEDVIALVSTSGSVLERLSYLPFGVATVMDSSWGTISGTAYDWIYRFQNMRLDSVSGLLEADFRWYSATEGRWLSNDPILFEAGDVNFYRAMGNEPVGRTDPTGLDYSYESGDMLIFKRTYYLADTINGRDYTRVLGKIVLINGKQYVKRGNYVVPIGIVQAAAEEGQPGWKDPANITAWFKDHHESDTSSTAGGGATHVPAEIRDLTGVDSTWGGNQGVDRAAAVAACGREAAAAFKDEYIYGPLLLSVVFTKQMISSSEVIARGRQIRKIDELVANYGGTAKGWIKASAHKWVI